MSHTCWSNSCPLEIHVHDDLKTSTFALKAWLLQQIFVLRTSKSRKPLLAESSVTETLYCSNRDTENNSYLLRNWFYIPQLKYSFPSRKIHETSSQL